MKNLKKLTSVFLAVIMLLAMNTTAFAAVSDTGFSDVAANAWYADAVTYVRGHGLMSGTSTTTFSPEATTSRGQIAAILYRAAGSPAPLRRHMGGRGGPGGPLAAYQGGSVGKGTDRPRLRRPAAGAVQETESAGAHDPQRPFAGAEHAADGGGVGGAVKQAAPQRRTKALLLQAGGLF